MEIAFFDRGPIDATQLMMGGHWSAYWHDGHIYATEIARGLDVLKLVPSDYLSESELAAAELISAGVSNPQQQRRIQWPAQPVVARALLDQLKRDGALAMRQVVRRGGCTFLDEADAVLAGADSRTGRTSPVV